MKCPLPRVESRNRVPIWYHETIRHIQGDARASHYIPITHIDIFDFDGTLFHSPNPNIDLWRKVEHAFTTQRTPETLTTKHKLLVEKVADGGLGWYQSVETLLPPLVTSPPQELAVTDDNAPKTAISPANIRLVHKKRNYFAENDRDILEAGLDDSDLVFSDRIVLAECSEGNTETSKAPQPSPRSLFSANDLSEYINADVLRELRESAADDSHLTIVLTGRNILFTRIVAEILQQFGVEVDDIKMKPLVMPREFSAGEEAGSNMLASVLREGAFNPITTLGIKEEYLSKIIAYYASPLTALQLVPEWQDGAVPHPPRPHVRIFEDRQQHIAKFAHFLETQRDRPLVVRWGEFDPSGEQRRTPSSFGAHIENPTEKFLVECYGLIGGVHNLPSEVSQRTETVEEVKRPREALIRRDFTFEVIHVTEKRECLPMAVEFAVIAHLQRVHNTVLFDLCAVCCFPKGAGGSGDVFICQCSETVDASENPFAQAIAKSRSAFIGDLAGMSNSR